MQNPIRRYTHWLHTQWPAGHVEKLPIVHADGSTDVPGVYVAGDLAGIPLLKFSSDTGARAVRTILDDPTFARRDKSDVNVLDLVIIGSGVAAAVEARRTGLRFEIIEASEPLSTIANFPCGKPIYTYPTEMIPAGDLQFSARADARERLLEELRGYMDRHDIRPRHARATRVTRRSGLIEAMLADGPPLTAHRAIVAIGRSGNHRRLNVPGEDRDKVYNRLYDPADHAGRRVLVVGGGDSAMEAAIALTRCGARVTLSYRKPQFSRPKPENLEQVQKLTADPRTDVAIEEPTSERGTTATGDFVPPGETPGALALTRIIHEPSSPCRQGAEPEGVDSTPRARKRRSPAPCFALVWGIARHRASLWCRGSARGAVPGAQAGSPPMSVVWIQSAVPVTPLPDGGFSDSCPSPGPISPF